MTQKNRASTFRKVDAQNEQSHPAIVPQEALIAKRFFTAQSKLALSAISVRRVEGGGYFVSGRNFATYCRQLADLESLVEGVAK